MTAMCWQDTRSIRFPPKQKAADASNGNVWRSSIVPISHHQMQPLLLTKINLIGDREKLHCNMTQGSLILQTSLDLNDLERPMTVLHRI
jgi:hypothetical protein